MITVQIDKTKGVFLRLPVMSEKVRANMSRAVHQLATELRTIVIRDKLSGQVLNKITGHLQQSIQQEVTEASTKITGKVYSAGDVKYAAIHEYGGVILPKNADYLVFQIQGQWKKVKSVTMPERSYLRSTLHEQEPHIIEVMERAAMMGVTE